MNQTSTTLILSEVQAALNRYSGNQALSGALHGANNDGALFLIFMEYIHYSGIFAGAVAKLAGEISLQYNVFQDKNQPFMLRDRSHEVAAYIFAAAIDEFAEPSLPGRVTHRALARTTRQLLASRLDRQGQIRDRTVVNMDPFGDDAVFNTGSCRHAGTIDSIICGHRFSRWFGCCRSVFEAIGFHLGSETLAEGEFQVIANFLKYDRPDLLQYLQSTPTETDGQPHQGDLWVRIHTTVEEQHASAALVAANLALQYYVGNDGEKERAKQWILQGVQSFAKVQWQFMKKLSG